MAFTPVITRLYGPEAFGLLGTFVSIVAVVTPIAALAYPIAIVLPKNDNDAFSIVKLSATSAVITAFLATVVFWITGDWLAKILGLQSVASYLPLVPVAMFLAAWMQIGQQWLIRKKVFSVLAQAAIAKSLILNAAKTGFGFLNPAAATLILLSTLGHGIHAALLLTGARRNYRASDQDNSKSPKANLKVLAASYKDFPLYRAPQRLINAASQSLPVLMLSALFGPASAGFYTLGKMTMGIPSLLVGKAVTDVFYPRITEAAHNGENLSKHIFQATSILLALAILPFGVITLFGPSLFSIVFGQDWATAGEYARWLALFFLFNFANKPSVAAVPVLGIQRGLLIYEIFSTGGKVIGLFLGFYWFNSDIYAVALFSLIGVAAYSAMIVWILLRAKQWRTRVHE